MHSTTRRLPSWVLYGGVLALVGATATAGSFAAAGFTNRFVGIALAAGALNVLPPIGFEYGILRLGSLARPLLIVTMTLCAIVAFAIAAGIGSRGTVGRSPAVRGAVFFLGLTRSRGRDV